jgi:type VI protein secretion system component Hcp
VADNNQGDVLMFFAETRNGLPIAAESTSTVPSNPSGLMKGFKPGHYFEVDEFNFSISLADDEGGSGLELDHRSYSRWRSMKDAVTPDPPFKAEPGDVVVERTIDTSSPLLLQHCLDSKRFEQAVLVKRARTGSAGELAPMLRIEFSDVRIRSIEWEDDDAVQETCKFSFSAVDITYVGRRPDGSENGKPVNCGWKSEPKEKEKPGG